MTNDDYLAAARNMEHRGGSFAAYIALAYFAADSYHARILETSFRHLFERYKDSS